MKIKKLITASLMAALACAATFIQIPYGVGYVNLGDCIVLLSGWWLGPLYGALASGIGPMLADLFMGYYIYAPATFVIKAIMAVVAFYSAKMVAIKPLVSSLFSGILAETVMILGYFIFETIVYDVGMAIPGLFGNSIQGLVSIVCAVLLQEINSKKRFWKS